jgi:hypothetical protein
LRFMAIRWKTALISKPWQGDGRLSPPRRRKVRGVQPQRCNCVRVAAFCCARGLVRRFPQRRNAGGSVLLFGGRGRKSARDQRPADRPSVSGRCDTEP